jgi:RecJ-like exonuclease
MNDDLKPEEQKPGDEAPADEPSSGENICPVCGGSGEKDGSRCDHCEGTGKVIEPIGGG